tara:strand:+ start:604 stop:921 length:318 start_codon:yes stop_codon:yes gene_type:complete
MSQSNYITLALFAVIGLVFLIDYLKKRKNDSLEKSVEKFVEKESKTKERSGVLNWILKILNWILKRKKNIAMFIFALIILKVMLHFFLYPEMDFYSNKPKFIIPQ